MWVKGIDRQHWDPTSRDHTPASRGFHGNMPEMRDFGERERERVREITMALGWGCSGREECVISPRAIQRSKKISGIWRGGGDAEREREDGPRGFSQVLLRLLICYDTENMDQTWYWGMVGLHSQCKELLLNKVWRVCAEQAVSQLIFYGDNVD